MLNSYLIFFTGLGLMMASGGYAAIIGWRRGLLAPFTMKEMKVVFGMMFLGFAMVLFSIFTYSGGQ